MNWLVTGILPNNRYKAATSNKAAALVFSNVLKIAMIESTFSSCIHFQVTMVVSAVIKVNHRQDWQLEGCHDFREQELRDMGVHV